MELHIGYESEAPFALKRTDTPDEKASKAGLPPKANAKGDQGEWVYPARQRDEACGSAKRSVELQARNRSALEWILDQYKEKKPKDPTIREKFDTYRFADYKEKVIELLSRVTTVSVETMRITKQMRDAPH